MTVHEYYIFEKFLETQNIDDNTQKKLLKTFKRSFLTTNTPISKKSINKRLSNYKDATSKGSSAENDHPPTSLWSMRSAVLQGILSDHNKNKNGSKKDLVDRVWWILHQDTPCPDNLELKKRGRPSSLNNNSSAFIDSSDEEDDGDLDELMKQHNIPKTWNKIFISNDKINTSGREHYRYKDTDFIFKKTIDGGYIPQGYITNQLFTRLNVNTDSIPPELEQIITSLY
jgi:hypothetical protein